MQKEDLVLLLLAYSVWILLTGCSRPYLIEHRATGSTKHHHYYHGELIVTGNATGNIEIPILKEGR